MDKELKLISPIAPTVNHYMNYRVGKMRGKNMVIPYPSKETKEYKKCFIPYVKEQAKLQGWVFDETGTQHYYVFWTVYFPRVDMDVANQDKVIIDSITESEAVWKDDNVVLNRVEHIYYDTKNPRIELTIKPAEYIGIFNNLEELNKFEDRCKNCSRYKRNCSILNKAKQGRIQEEINSLECLKYNTKQN